VQKVTPAVPPRIETEGDLAAAPTHSHLHVTWFDPGWDTFLR
jgi:hypothetical protein